MILTSIGVDPGVNGGVAILSPDRSLIAYRMPETDADIAEMFQLIKNRYDGEVVAFIEKVHAMPGQGSCSMFTFGKNYGTLLGVLAALRFRVEHVQPKAWQKGVGVTYPPKTPYPERKRIAKARAQDLFPGFAVTKETADSILISEYGRRVTLQG